MPQQWESAKQYKSIAIYFNINFSSLDMEEWRREKYFKSLARIIFRNLLMGVQEEKDLIDNDHIITIR